MLWREYAHQPASRLFKALAPPDPDAWLELVERAGFMRVSGHEPGQQTAATAREVADALGRFFRPEVPPALTVLQVGGLLLRDGKLDEAACRRAARKYGGRLYFDWFMAQLDLHHPDPLPGKAFPLHRSRWRKVRGGRGRGHATASPRKPPSTVSGP